MDITLVILLRGGWMFGKNKESFGHNGWGGSLGFGDPIEGIGIAYVTRKINSGMGADSRAVNLIKKLTIFFIINFLVGGESCIGFEPAKGLIFFYTTFNALPP